MDHDDMAIKLFVLSLEDDAQEWFRSLLDGCITSWENMKEAFRIQYGDRTDPRFLLENFETVKKNTIENVQEGNTGFNKILNRIHDNIRPSEQVSLIKYCDSFDKKATYLLRDKAPTNARKDFTMAIQI